MNVFPILYRSFSLLLVGMMLCTFAAAQQIQVAPNADVWSLRQAWNQEVAPHIAAQASGGTENVGICTPDNLFNYFVQVDSLLTVEVDTFTVGGGSLALDNCQALAFGTVTLDTTYFTYTPNASVQSGIDTVCFRVCRDDNTTCSVLKYPIFVRRKGLRHVEPTVTVTENGFINSICADVTRLEGDIICSRLLPIKEGYAGEGNNIVYFTNYTEPNPCIRYKASRFHGVDTVYLRLCDEFAICDTFLLPVRITGDTLRSLPFFDDFSYDGPYPSTRNWLDRDGFVNQTLALNPPSVGILTMDGLDKTGSPYTQSGVADHLTSRYIDLSSFTAANDINLKFFAAPKGLGLYPNQNDSLTLAFKNSSGNWVNRKVFPGIDSLIPINTEIPFTFFSIAIDEPEFLHKGFQFRLVNTVSPAGIYDLWHVDYFELSAGRGDVNNFQDVAFTAVPDPMLTTYRHIPWRHLRASVTDNVQRVYNSSLYNHFFNEDKSLGTANILTQELNTGTTFPFFTLVETGPDNNIASQQPVQRSRTMPASVQTSFDNSFGGINGNPLVFETSYFLTQSSQANQYTVNDTVSTKVYCEDKFGYDDGSGEYYVFLQYPQISSFEPQVAVKFTAAEDDTLRAIEMHFPHVNGNIASQFFNLNVWTGSLEGAPAWTGNLKRVRFPDATADTLMGFTTYRLEDDFTREPTPVYLPKGDFYIGWQQVTVAEKGVPVGYDLNTRYTNINDEAQFVNFGATWIPMSEVGLPVGAIMMRAVVGAETPANTSAVSSSPLHPSGLKLQPNPSDQRTTLVRPAGWEKSTATLLDVNGRMVINVGNEDYIQVSSLPNGVYFVRFVNFATAETATLRLVVHH